MSGLPSEPVSNRVAAAMLLLASKANEGSVSIEAALQALVHTQLAALDQVADMSAPVVQSAAPADRVLYRDRDGDLWTCGADGMPSLMLRRASRKSGHVWQWTYSSLGDVERGHGPLHVVPWPGEVR